VACVVATASVATAKIWNVPGECPTIQAGIDSAAAGDTVLVADGTYAGDGNRDIDFMGKAILVTSENGPEVTVIDCEGTEEDPHRGFHFHSGEDASSVVQGFTITNGYAGGDGTENYGGAILCDASSSPTIVGNAITGNTAAYYGGGICCYDYSSPTIEGNTIAGNTAYWYGGGGILCRYSSPTIEGNTVIGNKAIFGGGVHCSYSSPAIEGNTITGNTADYGGGIDCSGYSSPTVLNSILWADSAGSGQEIYVDGTSSIDITFSDIEGGWEGEGNIDADPLFVLSEHRDYRLLWGSPCIDSGHPDSLDPDGTRSDMGAYPFDQSKPLTIYLTPDTTVITRPGELGVTYTLINIEPDPWTFWLRTDVTLPNGKPYPGNPIIGPKKVTLPGNKNIQRHMTHPIPGAAPLGIYTYKSRIGLPPGQLIDEDSFEFTVVEE
jgi:parallel beta-helix repeat protein